MTVRGESSKSLDDKWVFMGFVVEDGTPSEYDIELIEKDLMNHFNIDKGSCDWNPEYGNNLRYYMFENITSTTADSIRNEVNRVISSDPRLEPIDISIDEIEHGYNIKVDLKYMQMTVISLRLQYLQNT